MKRSGFTLIELIFVIVIIGVLAAVAVPKFQNLTQSAEASNVAKVTTDMASAGANVAVNLRDLEGNTTFNLRDLVDLSGRNWTWSDDKNATTYVDPKSGNEVAKINLTSLKTIVFGVDCEAFDNTDTQEKCGKLNDNNSTTAKTISF